MRCCPEIFRPLSRGFGITAEAFGFDSENRLFHQQHLEWQDNAEIETISKYGKAERSTDCPTLFF